MTMQLNGKLITMKGPDGILAMMEKVFGTRPYDPQHITDFHLVSNVRIQVDSDRATGYSRWTFVFRDPDKKPVVSMGALR